MSRTIDSIGSLPLPPRTAGHHPIGKTSKLLIDFLVASPSLNLIAFAFRFDRLVAGRWLRVPRQSGGPTDHIDRTSGKGRYLSVGAPQTKYQLVINLKTAGW